MSHDDHGTPSAGLWLIGTGPGAHDMVTVRGRRLLRAAQAVCYAPGISSALVAEAPLVAERFCTAELAAGAQWVRERLRLGRRVAWLAAGVGDDVFDAIRAHADLQATIRADGLAWAFAPGVGLTGVWADLPLSGRCVLVTRARHQAGSTCERLEALGAVALSMPTIAIAPVAADALAERACASLREYDRLIITSANAVHPLHAALRAAGRDARALAGLQICAIGPATARALATIGLCPDLTATDYRAEGLLELLPQSLVEGERILLFRAREARDLLPETLRQRGATVDLVPAYETTCPSAAEVAPGLAALRAGEVDAVLFTSASTAKHFAELVGDDLQRVLATVVVAAIGPVTADACRALGMAVQVVAQEYTIDGLVDELVAYFQRGAGREPHARQR